ncbi:DNA polymerase beta superfamily protein [Sphingobacterium sp.]|uniref:DNA polymerase beta superfamily protein n=1 Tax=Sphingobacterium sp. TaxID=341027 RepID=UPI002898B547|nr:nucleotidyltransferase domain-containing protein [Sphingobacterium sp.]
MTIDELRKNGLILFEAVVGSRAYGLATASSDTDIKGVFYLPLEYYLGGQYIAQVANASNDEVYYELGRFVELLSKSNPTVLELLASPADCIVYQDPIMEQFKMQDFITREAAMTFAQYAMVQVRKAKGLNKKINNPMNRERKSLLDFSFIIAGHGSLSLKEWLGQRQWKQENCGLAKIEHAKGMYALYYDQSETLGYKGIVVTLDSNEVSYTAIPKDKTLCAYLFVNHEAYSLQIQRPNREELLGIKNGTYNYDELFVWSHKLFEEVQELCLHSLLPEAPDQDKLRQQLVDIRKHLYHVKL